MRSPWLRLIVSFAALVAAFGTYRLLATPRLEPPRHASAGSQDVRYSGPLRSVERMPELARWFEAGAWELEFPQILETEYGVLLLKKYRTLDDGRLLIEPCTLVLKSDADEGGPAEAPIVLEAPGGAVLSVDRPLDLRSASVGKLVGGLLQGEIHIRRAGTSDNPPLDVYTRNVQIDESRIWTTQQVKFRYGETHGSGSDLLITLPTLKRGGKAPAASKGLPIRFMELVHVERIHVDLESLRNRRPPPPVRQASSDDERRQLPTRELPRSMEIQCDGPFRIDFQQQAAAFEKNVRMTLAHEGERVDRLQCNLLAAYFAVDEQTQVAAAAASTTDLPSAGGRFQLKRVVATGEPVILDAPNYKAAVQAERLEYDFEQRLLVLGDSHSVRLQHERFEVSARGGIEYQFPLVGSLGDLWAGGPGEFSGQISPESDQRLIATWGQRFQIHRQGEYQLLSLEGGASVDMDGFGGLRGGQLHLWLKPSEKPPAERHRADSHDAPEFAFEPDRLLAEDHVVVMSPLLNGQVERLEAWFRDAPAEQHGPPLGRLSEPISRLPAPTNEATAGRKPPAQQYQLVGRQARLHLLRAPEGEYRVDQVAVEGDVDLTETAAGPDDQPLRVRGDLLVLKHVQSAAATLRMIGNPAHLSGRGLTLRGGELLVDQAASTIDITTPGHLQLPLDGALPLPGLSSASPTSGNPLSARPVSGGVFPPVRPPVRRSPSGGEPSVLEVTWQKGCRFDGRTVRFHDQVEIRSGQQFASADSLAVMLDRPLEFDQGQYLAAREPPQLQRLLLEGNVNIEQRELDERGELASLGRASLPMLSIDQHSGEIASDGPGWFETVRYGSALDSSPGTAGNQNAAGERQPQLIHLKVHYARGIRGDLRTAHVRCFDQVQAIYGPIGHWNERLDLLRPETHGPKSIIMRCDQLQAADMGRPGGRQLEMTALGNTTVEGKTFTASCHRISYDGAKELLVMEGDGRRDAEVTQQSRVGGQQSHAAARQILFSLRDQSFHVNGAQYLDLNGPFAGGGF